MSRLAGPPITSDEGFSPGLLKAETIALLHTPLRLESGTATEYALGWKVDSVQLAGAPAQMLGHRGM